MASFGKAYEAIPLEALYTSAPDTTTYLTRAFQPDVNDFRKNGFLAIGLLRLDGTLVAYMSLDDVDQRTQEYPGLLQNSLYIRNLAVHPTEQGKGLGTLMVNEVLKEYMPLKTHWYVATRRFNKAACALYQKCGFKEETELALHYFEQTQYASFVKHFDN